MNTSAGDRACLVSCRLALSLTLSLATLAACHPRTEPAVAPSPPATSRLEQLRQTLDHLLSDPKLARGSWGVSVHSLDRADTLYELNAHKLMMPASTLKVVTLAVAAERLGWDYRYTTTLQRTGTVVDGILNGDLIIVGSGDPSFDDWDGVATATFTRWAEQLKAAGIREVSRRVVGDDDVFDEEGLGSGWAWDDVADGYSALVGGLQINQNIVQMVITPGASLGAPPLIEYRPPWAGALILNNATTALGGSPLALRPQPRSMVVELRGTIEPEARPVIRNIGVQNPTIYFAALTREALVANGIAIGWDPADADTEVLMPIDRAGAVVVADYRSPPLAAIGATMFRLSQNLYAESLLKTLGRESATHEGTAAAGRAVVNEQLDAWGISSQEMLTVDGSGLSRYNLATSDAMASVLDHVYRDQKLQGPFMAALPVAGAPGMLEQRMQGTAAEENAHAKTGSFSNARALAGYVRTVDGEMMSFAIFANNYNAPAGVVDSVTDSVVAAIAGFSRK